RSDCPPVFDQQNLGSCTANSIANAISYVEKVDHAQSHSDAEDLKVPSRLFIYYNERKEDGDIQEDAGSTLHQGINVINKYGACEEAVWPYEERLFAEQPTYSAYLQAEKHKGVRSFAVAQTEYELKHCLGVLKKPIVFGFQVYDSFESQEVARTGVLPMPRPGERVLGGHAVCAVGYTPDYFIIRNSWGTGWGQEGYFLMPNAFILNPAYAS